MSGSTTPGKPETPNKGGEDDEDDVKFNINIKKPEEKKDDFDDDEENPLAKIAVKPRNKNAPAAKKGGAGHVGKGGEKGKHKREETLERPFLAPNEKQFGVSCYQFEPSQLPGASQPAPAPPSAPPPAPLAASSTVPAPAAAAAPPPAPAPAPAHAAVPAKKATQQKSCDAGGRTTTRTISTLPTITTTTQVAPTPVTAPKTVNANTKSTISMTNQPPNKKPKSNEPEDKNLEKTQKD